MLFNLPGQSQDEMLADARAAADLGLEQICFYHLVMFDGLDTEWSRDRSLLAQMSRAARTHALTCSWDAVFDSVLAAYPVARTAEESPAALATAV